MNSIFQCEKSPKCYFDEIAETGNSVFKNYEIFFYLKYFFFMFLDYFNDDVKNNFFKIKKIYFNIFLNI